SRGLLLEQGFWRPGHCGELVRLFGVAPDPAELKECASAYLVMLCNLYCQPQPQVEAAAPLIAALSHPENRPASLRGADLSVYRDVSLSRATLLQVLDAELSRHRDR